MAKILVNPRANFFILKWYTYFKDEMYEQTFDSATDVENKIEEIKDKYFFEYEAYYKDNGVIERVYQ